jgi:polysaccharide export outer membrane protein
LEDVPHRFQPRARVLAVLALACLVATGCGGKATLTKDVEKAGPPPEEGTPEGEEVPEGVAEEDREELREINEFVSEAGGEYKIGISDQLTIVFYGDPSLDRSVKVRPDGKISFPRIGDIPAAGLTPVELSSAITELYAEFLRNPEATVIVDETGSQVVYVMGEVKSAGAVEIRGRMTLSQAIAEAGGWTTTARLESVMLVRRGTWEKPRAIRIDFQRVLSGDQIGFDVAMQPFDIVYVPQTFIGNAADFSDELFNRFITAPFNAIVRGYDAFYPRSAVRTR